MKEDELEEYMVRCKAVGNDQTALKKNDPADLVLIDMYKDLKTGEAVLEHLQKMFIKQGETRSKGEKLYLEAQKRLEQWIDKGQNGTMVKANQVYQQNDRFYMRSNKLPTYARKYQNDQDDPNDVYKQIKELVLHDTENCNLAKITKLVERYGKAIPPSDVGLIRMIEDVVQQLKDNGKRQDFTIKKMLDTLNLILHPNDQVKLEIYHQRNPKSLMAHADQHIRQRMKKINMEE